MNILYSRVAFATEKYIDQMLKMKGEDSRLLKSIQHLPLNDRIHILCSIQPKEDIHGDGGCCQDVCEMVEPDMSQILGLLPSILQTREARDPSKILSEDL